LMRLAALAISPFVTLGPVLRANARTERVPDADVGEYLAAARTMRPSAFRRVSAEVLSFRVPQGADACPVRLLAVAGEQEPALVVRSQPELAAGFRHGVARLAPGVGHAWHTEAPDLFTEMIRAHLSGGPPPKALRLV